MFARSLRPLAAKGARQASSSSKHSSVNGKGAFNALYGAFMKNNMTYVTSIVVAAIAVEAVYGSATNYIWESANRGVRSSNSSHSGCSHGADGVAESILVVHCV